MPGDFPRCDMTTELTDVEIAQIVRAAASASGVTPSFEAIGITAECRLANRHAGDCAGWVADLIDHPATAWIRWGEGRRIDWLASCTGSCILYLGHPGICDWAEKGEATPNAH